MTMDNLHLNLEVALCDGSQPFEMIDDGKVGWFSPREYLRQLPGVVKAEYLDTTSSAGDWNGWYAVEVDDEFALIMFSQENRYPSDVGYTLQTGEAPFAYVASLDDNVLDAAISQLYEND